jgi:hypothetical protein
MTKTIFARHDYQLASEQLQESKIIIFSPKLPSTLSPEMPQQLASKTQLHLNRLLLLRTFLLGEGPVVHVILK